MTTKRKTDYQRVLSILLRGGSITTMKAFEMGICRLSARIYEIRKNLGHECIETKFKHVNGENVAIYKWRKAA